jgi:hypothetical protein
MYKCKEETDSETIKKAIKEWEASPDRVHKYLEDEKAEFTLHGKKWSIYGSPVSEGPVHLLSLLVESDFC